ncbi:MAG: PleD family two-component response regulator [Psychroserpens sp.]|jgi:PleD family two-component response regulator
MGTNLIKLVLGAIIMLTALDDDIDEVTGLEVDADDHLCKPINPGVLLQGAVLTVACLKLLYRFFYQYQLM